MNSINALGSIFHHYFLTYSCVYEQELNYTQRLAFITALKNGDRTRLKTIDLLVKLKHITFILILLDVYKKLPMN